MKKISHWVPLLTSLQMSHILAFIQMSGSVIAEMKPRVLGLQCKWYYHAETVKYTYPLILERSNLSRWTPARCVTTQNNFLQLKLVGNHYSHGHTRTFKVKILRPTFSYYTTRLIRQEVYTIFVQDHVYDLLQRVLIRNRYGMMKTAWKGTVRFMRERKIGMPQSKRRAIA